MNHLFIEFRDPLFGIIIFFFLLFIITFLSYWWGKIRAKGSSKELDDFLEQFHSLPTEDELKNLIENATLSEKSWFLLASSYAQNGEFEKAIEIYQILLSHFKNSPHTNETLFLLAKTYLKAGFLERAKELFLTILRHSPRTPQALHYLLLIYEQLKDYKQAQNILEPLDELGEDIALEKAYLSLQATINETTLKAEEKSQRIVDIYSKHKKLSYLVFDYLFKHSPSQAWQIFDQSQAPRLTSILWHLDKAHLDLDIISSNSYLRELFSANGSLNLANNSSIFEFDILIKLKNVDETAATLQFEYLCSSCKQLLPFAFERCPCCYEIDTLVCELSLTPKSVPTYHSFL